MTLLEAIKERHTVRNYIALIGKKADDLEERCGYYGEKIAEDEELVLSFAIGYSEESGKAHKFKSIEELSTVKGEVPDWFLRGMEYAALAPSAGNQQLYNIQ